MSFYFRLPLMLNRPVLILHRVVLSNHCKLFNIISINIIIIIIIRIIVVNF